MFGTLHISIHVRTVPEVTVQELSKIQSKHFESALKDNWPDLRRLESCPNNNFDTFLNYRNDDINVLIQHSVLKLIMKYMLQTEVCKILYFNNRQWL